MANNVTAIHFEANETSEIHNRTSSDDYIVVLDNVEDIKIIHNKIDGVEACELEITYVSGRVRKLTRKNSKAPTFIQYILNEIRDGGT